MSGVSAVFFDRDGVLIRDKHYLSDPDEIEWLAGAQAAIAHLKILGFLVFVVTNQSGVARGYFDEASVLRVHDRLQSDLAGRGRIDAFAYCPHHPTGIVYPYNVDCECRKPKSGMIRTLMEAWSCDQSACFLVGDKVSDIDAAAAAGIQGYLFNAREPFADLELFITNILKNREIVKIGGEGSR